MGSVVWKKRVVAGACMALSAGATADVVGVYSMPENQQMTVLYKDDENVRVNMSPDSYMLVREGRAYMVNRDGGQWQVTDLEQMRKQMHQLGMGGMMNQGMSPAEQNEETAAQQGSFEDTGRTETVAGIEGHVYVAKSRDPESGRVQEQEIVLTDDHRVIAVQNGMARAMTQTMGSLMGSGPMDKGFFERPPGAAGPQGMLRAGHSMKLTKVEERDIAEGKFQLPAEPSSGGVGPMHSSGRGEHSTGHMNEEHEEHGSMDGHGADGMVEGAKKMLEGLFGG